MEEIKVISKDIVVTNKEPEKPYKEQAEYEAIKKTWDGLITNYENPSRMWF